MPRDLAHRISESISTAPISITGATNGTGVDMSGYESLAMIVACGAQGGTSPVLTVQLQESSDNATWALVADNQVLALSGVNSAAFSVAASSIVELGYIGSKRYVRAIFTLTGTSPTAVVAAIAVLSHARNLPAA